MSTATIDDRKYQRLLGKALPVVIRSETECRRLMKAAEELIEKPEETLTAEERRLVELLSMLLEEYEDRVHPLPKTDPGRMLARLVLGHPNERPSRRSADACSKPTCEACGARLDLAQSLSELPPQGIVSASLDILSAAGTFSHRNVLNEVARGSRPGGVGTLHTSNRLIDDVTAARICSSRNCHATCLRVLYRVELTPRYYESWYESRYLSITD